MDATDILILDSANGVLQALANLTTLGLLLVIVSFLYWDDRAGDEAEQRATQWRKRIPLVGALFTILWVAYATIPSVDDLVRSHVVAEGAKVLTAENVEKLVDEVAKRVDKALEK